MDRGTVNNRLTRIFRDVFENDAIEIAARMTADDIPQWDSLTHIDLIVAVEKEFHISFTTREVHALKNVGDLIGLIAGKAG